MTTTKNNEHKKLNVPNKQEQNQTCLDSAEREGLSPKGNVPNLRFPEFQGEWSVTTLQKDCIVNPTNEKIADKFVYVDLESVKQGQLYKYQILTKDNAPSRAQRVLHTDDILFQCVRPYQMNNYMVKGTMSDIQWVASTGYAQIRTQTDYPAFLYYVLNTSKYNKAVMVRCTGSSYPAINSEDLSKIPFYKCGIAEQKKIADFLFLLDERIATQNKVIDKLQSLIKGMEDNLLDNPLWKKTYLRSFMQFFPTNSLSWEQLSYKEGAIRNLHYGLIHGLQTRGINSASLPMIKNEAIPKQYTLCQVGDVAFADASEDTGEIAKSVEFVDTIESDTICGLHTIHGRDIKNRTVVGFKGFAFNSRYFHNQIKRLAQGTKVFSITANNLSSCYVYLPDLETQKAIVKLLKAYEEKLLVSKRLLEHYEKQKQYLLRQMFI